jgi:hypothetical protein
MIDQAYPSHKTPTLSLLILTFLLLAAIGLALLRYAELPFTDHARQAHAGETWNATSIAEYFDQGGCTPTEYACPDLDFRVAYCEIDGGKSIGLTIGLKVQQVITGFMASTDYWQNRCP